MVLLYCPWCFGPTKGHRQLIGSIDQDTIAVCGPIRALPSPQESSNRVFLVELFVVQSGRYPLRIEIEPIIPFLRPTPPRLASRKSRTDAFNRGLFRDDSQHLWIVESVPLDNNCISNIPILSTVERRHASTIFSQH